MEKQGTKFIFGFGSTCATRCNFLGAEFKILGAQLQIPVAPTPKEYLTLQKEQLGLLVAIWAYSSSIEHNREIKFDVTWSYVKRQMAKMTSEFVFFSSNPSLNHINVEKCLLLFTTNTNIFTLLFKELKTDGKSFIFAV